MEKYSYHHLVFQTEAGQLGEVAKQLNNIANEKAIANRIEIIKFLYDKSIDNDGERVKLLDELRNI